jgi:hypothetical protein
MNDRARRIANLPPEQRRRLELMLQERVQARTDEGIPALPRHSESGQPVVFPLSPAQSPLWLREQHRPGSSYPGTPTLRLRGPLDVAALEASLGEICARHETLRTTFDTRDGEPVQIVGPPRPVSLTRVDLRELPPPAREEEAGRLLAREAKRPFDLSLGPMLRATLLRLDEEEHVLLLVVHHIVCDGWSLDVLFRELEALYRALRSGERANLPELPVQYADYAVWQRQRLQDGALRKSTEYWKKQLADTPKKGLDIPTDRPRQSVRTSGGAWQELRMPASLLRELHALCRRQNVTLFVAVLAGWATLLHRYSGQDDILIASPVANRNRVEVEGVIGPFANNLVLRHDLAGDPSFAELLGRVRETTVDAFSHGELPFREIIKESRSKPRVVFQLQRLGYIPKLDGLQVERILIDHDARLRSLGLLMFEGDEGLTARLNYDPDLFEAATAARMLGDLRTLLESVVADPEQHVSKLPLPVRPERPARSGGRQARFGKRLRHAARSTRRRLRRAGRSTRKRLRQAGQRARRTIGWLRARIKNGPFFG